MNRRTSITALWCTNHFSFEVTLPRECDFPITLGGQEFKFRFATTVGGVIRSGSIHEVYGVRVQIKFGWLGLRQVDRAGDQLTLQVQQFTVISGQRLFREPILQLRLRLI